MKRRQFLAAVGGLAAAPIGWSLAARAQQAMPVVGFIRSASLAESTHIMAAFRDGIKDAGLIEGRNIAIEFRSSETLERLSATTAELIRRPVDMIVGDSVVAEAARAATSTLPILFAIGSDPVTRGLVASLNRPGGNVTGVVFFSGGLGAKRLQLLRQFVPKAETIGMLVNPGRPDTEGERRDVAAAARAIGQRLEIFDVSGDSDIDGAFAALVQRGAGGLLVGSGAFTNTHRKRIVALATRHALPTFCPLREFVEEGGLMSYGSSITDAYRHLGQYAARIFKGEKPADMPVLQATKFELVINLKTAKALGLEFHPQLLATADEVIE
jgi:putative ABC transport system substrate-binding protein